MNSYCDRSSYPTKYRRRFSYGSQKEILHYYTIFRAATLGLGAASRSSAEKTDRPRWSCR